MIYKYTTPLSAKIHKKMSMQLGAKARRSWHIFWTKSMCVM